MIQTTQTNFAKLINEERTNFETTMANSLSAQRQEQKDLDRPQILLKREVRDLIKEMQTTLALSLLHNADKEAVCTMILQRSRILRKTTRNCGAVETQSVCATGFGRTLRRLWRAHPRHERRGLLALRTYARHSARNRREHSRSRFVHTKSKVRERLNACGRH